MYTHGSPQGNHIANGVLYIGVKCVNRDAEDIQDIQLTDLESTRRVLEHWEIFRDLGTYNPHMGTVLHFDESRFGAYDDSTHCSPVTFLLRDSRCADTFSIRIGKWIREWIVIIIEETTASPFISVILVLIGLTASVVIFLST
jgi:hypothetical protein